MDKNYIFLGSVTPQAGMTCEVYGFWESLRIEKVRIDILDRGAVSGTAYTERMDCCEDDDRYCQLDFHGVLKDGYIRSIVIDAEREYNPEK